MAIRDLDHVVRHLEENAEDELALLESTGAEFFSTPQLWRLYGQWQIKNLLFRKVQKHLMRIAAFSPVWIAGWFLFSLLDWTYLALLSLFFFPASLFIFFAGLYYAYLFFKGKGHLDRTGEMIVDELKRRAGLGDGEDSGSQENGQ